MTGSADHPSAEFASPMEALHIGYTCAAARLVWAKTRERAKRRLDPDTMDWAVEYVFLLALGLEPEDNLQTALEENGATITPEHLAKAINEEPTQTLEVFVWILAAQGTPAQQAAFQACCRKMGRHPSVKALILPMNNILLKAGFGPSDEAFDELQIPKPLYEVTQTLENCFRQNLLAWAIPRTAQIDDLFRNYIAENPPPPIPTPEQVAAEEEVFERKSPPIQQLLSKATRLKLFKALTPIREFMARRTADPQPPTEADKAALRQLMEATLQQLRDILAPLHPRLAQNQVSLDDLCIDCLLLDSQLSKEEMLA